MTAMNSLALGAPKSVCGKCYCVPHSTDYMSIFPEDECFTNCIISYLGQQNTDVSLWLIENFLTENATMFFSSTCLKAFFAFLLNSDHSFTEKERVITILRDQFEQHPSCAPYTFQTYQNLLLEPEESHFKKLTLLDYLLNQLQNQVSSTDVCFSANRISRRTRKTIAYLENGYEVDYPGSSTEERVELLGKSSLTRDIVLVILDMLTEILTHDLRATLNRGQSPTKCILANLIFKGSSSTLLFQPMTYKLFEAYKRCTSAEEHFYVARLLELVTTLAWYVDREENEANFFRLGSCCERFVSDFLIKVFDEKEIREPYSMVKITSLNLIWLRYHATCDVLMKILSRKKISSGVEGVVNELCALLGVHKNELLNQYSNSTGIDEKLITACRTDDLETLQRLSGASIDLNNAFGDSGQSALHIAAQYGSVNCVSFLINSITGRRLLNLQLEDNEGFTALMYAERGSHAAIINMLTSHADKMAKRVKRLTPFLCKIFMIITDTTIKMLDKLDQHERHDTVQNLEQLLILIKELSQLKDVPKEIILWSRLLSKIEIID